MELEILIIALSEINHIQKGKYHMFSSHMWNLYLNLSICVYTY